MLGKRTIAAAAIMSAIGLPGVALAQNAVVTTDLNIRMGPGPSYEVITVIPVDQAVTIHGCDETMTWCEVSFGTNTGWAYADYLSYEIEGSPMVLREAAPQVDIPTVTYEARTTGTTTGAVGGAITGAIIGGPIGAAIGGVAGAAIGTAISPPQTVQTHVVAQPAQPVFLEGEVVVGAALPETVELYSVPDYDYRFAYVNHQRVLVDPGTRQIVYVVR